MRYAFGFVVIALFFLDAHAQFAPGYLPAYLPANSQISMTLCDAAASSTAYPHYFHLAFSMHAGGTRDYSPKPPVFGGGVVDGDTPNLAAGTQCQPVTISTSGVTSTSTSSVITSSCYDYTSTGGGRACSSALGLYTFRTPVAPSVTKAPASVGVSFSGPTTVAETITLNPNFATLTIAPSCTQQNGAVITVQPHSAGSNITGDAGTAQFDVTTNIGTPVPGQAPSGNCIFSVPASSNGANVSLPVIGSVYQPSLAIISPTLPINHPGSTTITTKVSPSFGGVQIDQSCSVSGGTTITPMTANKLTSSSGQAAFTINVQNLAVVNPNTSVTPTASCTFTVHSGTGTAIASFSTGNACAYGLQPAPPGCGNP